MPRWFLLLLLTLILQLPGTAVLPLMDRDEPRFAGATFEMMQRQTWLVPYFNDVYRFDKPPLTYWWMRIHYLLGGVNELTARLHSVTATWLTALVILGIGTRLFSARAGMAAAVVWLTSLQVLVHGRLCVADMPMILFVTLSMRALIELIGVSNVTVETKKREPKNKWFWALYLALGLGFLAKGPVAVLAPCLALLLYRWGEENRYRGKTCVWCRVLH
jgi:4-amino-4-deoxy-L-arabinose transferase-like glycosyltransferase